MTVLTKPITSKKPDELKEALIFPEVHSGKATQPPIIKVKHGDVEAGEAGEVGVAGGPPDAGRAASRTKKSSRAPGICFTMSILIFFIFSLVGIQFFRTLKPPRYFRGMCRVPIGKYMEESMVSGNFRNGQSRDELRFLDIDNPVTVFQSPRRLSDPAKVFVFGKPVEVEGRGEAENGEERNEVNGLQPVIEPQLTGESLSLRERILRDGTVEFDVELDLDFDEVETFELPEISQGRYMHDFRRNKTAIIDVEGGRCFIMPLDRDEIPRPRNLFEMLNNMRNGAYEMDYQEIKHNTRVVLPALQSLQGFGTFIGQECADKTTYLLEEATDVVVKRSVDNTESGNVFAEFTGRAVVKYNIVNLQEAPAATANF